MQDDSNEVLQLLRAQWHVIPMLVVYGIGALMAIINWGRHPRVSACALGAFSLWSLSVVGNAVVYAFVVHELSVGGGDHEAVVMIQDIARMMFMALSITAYALIICAVFGWRREPSGGMQ
ncbi:MAG: hypothetical protein JNL58_03345 [Planctomyces sp.]|nr:hypothetical protein [Planctomyces sp.]